jgi:hypothetical protein
LVLLAEIAHNLDAVIVAVNAARAAGDGSSARLHKLLDTEAKGIAAIVIEAPDSGAEAAIEYARRSASLLVAENRTVLLAVDRVAADEVGETVLQTAAGVAAGSVTAIRVAPHARDAASTQAWSGADATAVLSLTEASVGQFPALDILACRSSVLEHLDGQTRRTAEECRELLRAAHRARHYLAQPFWMAEGVTGVPAEVVNAKEATAGLIRALHADDT